MSPTDCHLAPEAKRDEEIWFEDGNIIIVAGDTAFRLYKGILSAASLVFKDLFSVPQPEDGETMDNCPVIRLPDPATDLRHFFRAVTKPDFSHLRHDYKPAFGMLAAVCRIGHKYQADEVVDAAAARIENFFARWPSTAATIISKNRGRMPLTWELFWWAHNRLCLTAVEIQDAFEAVGLARLLGRPSILPFALYLCCAGDPLHMRDGVPRPDGAVSRLSSEDYLRCIQAIPKLRAACSDKIRSVLARSMTASVLSDCTNGGQCAEVFEMMHRDFIEEKYVPVVTDLFASIRFLRTKPVAYTTYYLCLCSKCVLRLDVIEYGGEAAFLTKVFEL
ncbi:hypothetical protein BD310DRAFT_728839 [Dichomitus squalens]|uniref:BTB domain-containing protein n=1 Tax=Dichomitus squalens TaxID=114155 RepID=A0A4Q9PKR1_9APHY|nr:hypothetical protein BD310DRAFT_728839 [Dichomitus squalens]